MAYGATGSYEGMPPDVHVTRIYVVALEYGLEKVRRDGASAINCDLVKELHARLMDGIDYNGTPGQFRDKQNWIGGGDIYNATHAPPPPGNVQDCINALETLHKYSPPEESRCSFMLGLVRYIHLNPLRAGLVEELCGRLNCMAFFKFCVWKNAEVRIPFISEG